MSHNQKDEDKLPEHLKYANIPEAKDVSMVGMPVERKTEAIAEMNKNAGHNAELFENITLMIGKRTTLSFFGWPMFACSKWK